MRSTSPCTLLRHLRRVQHTLGSRTCRAAYGDITYAHSSLVVAVEQNLNLTRTRPHQCGVRRALIPERVHGPDLRQHPSAQVGVVGADNYTPHADLPDHTRTHRVHRRRGHHHRESLTLRTVSTAVHPLPGTSHSPTLDFEPFGSFGSLHKGKFPLPTRPKSGKPTSPNRAALQGRGRAHRPASRRDPRVSMASILPAPSRGRAIKTPPPPRSAA